MPSKAPTMHRLRHERHPFNAPVSEAKVGEAIALLDLPPRARVLDIGCGTGEELLRAASALELDCHGVDLDEEALEFAEELRDQKYGGHLKGTVEFLCKKWQDHHDGDASWDAVFCIGSTQAFGDVYEGFHNALLSIRDMLKPGGYLLLGDLYWRKVPSHGYLKMLDCDASAYNVWPDDVDAAKDAGFEVVRAWESTKDEFDVFEHAYWAAAEQMAADNPDDPDKQAKWRSIRQWRDMYQKEGRDTLGFGLYLLRKR